MSNQQSRVEYQARLHRVMAYIDRRLDQPLNLARIAKVAHFSPFHFHRLFTAMTGETLGDYARRRRLEIAAVTLVTQPRASILDIALSVGFGSAEALTHAFKNRFKVSPTVWRKRERDQRSKANQIESKMDQAHPLATSQNFNARRKLPEDAMKVITVHRSPTLISYLRHVGPYGQAVNQFWQTKVYPWMVSNELLDRPRYGISHDDPGVTEDSKCRYDAAVEVQPGFKSVGRAFTTTLPGGQFASTEFKGTVTQIVGAWTRLLRDWLPSSGLKMDARPAFEFYPPGSSFDPATGVFDCQIFIPVVRL